MALLGFTFVPLSGFSQSADSLQKTLLSTIEANLKKDAYLAEIITFPGLLSAPKLPEPSKKYLTLCAGINHPFARGSIHVASKDPLAPPAIDPVVFAEPYDLTTMVETVKFIRCTAKEEPLKSLLSGVELNPGEEYQTDEEIAEYLRAIVGPTFHTIGSASMMPLEEDGVIDANLKAYKTTNIRIADTSIVPLHVGAHTQGKPLFIILIDN
ncbi:GMC oxidoreductase-domain-containing protein [Phellopilus nigrolimitatus]|nr:GMC oxidoreductase-domain-containing protein [Phellopilus nigrolimitatus]